MNFWLKNKTLWDIRMPLKLIDYNNVSFYKIVCNDLNIKHVYVGHTTSFIKRRAMHKSSCNNKNNASYKTKLYSTIRENGDFCNWSMLLLECCSCEDSLHARKKEREFIELLKADLNCTRPCITKEEAVVYRTENSRKYHEANKDKINEKHKEYRLVNKDNIAIKKKEYRLTNKEKISDKAKLKITCECGSICRLADKPRHDRTKKHRIYVDSIIN